MFEEDWFKTELNQTARQKSEKLSSRFRFRLIPFLTEGLLIARDFSRGDLHLFLRCTPIQDNKAGVELRRKGA